MPDLDAARRELEEALGADAVLSDPLALRLYARDASMVEGAAGLVVFPRSTDDAVACVLAAAAHDLNVVPRGSGTGLSGASTPIDDALVVVTSKMGRVLETRPQDRLAWVEPGLFNLDLAMALRGTGFTYMPDPSSQQVSSIGGNVATNAGGPHCLAYGVTSAHVLALDVVLCDGTVARVGSEAPAIRTMLMGFAAVEDCAATVSAIIAGGVVPAALEMMDQGIVRAVEAFAHAGYPTDAAAVLLVEVDGIRAGVDAEEREV